MKVQLHFMNLFHHLTEVRVLNPLMHPHLSLESLRSACTNVYCFGTRLNRKKKHGAEDPLFLFAHDCH